MKLGEGRNGQCCDRTGQADPDHHGLRLGEALRGADAEPAAVGSQGAARDDPERPLKGLAFGEAYGDRDLFQRLVAGLQHALGGLDPDPTGTRRATYPLIAFIMARETWTENLRAIAALDIRDGDHVLDLGCGHPPGAAIMYPSGEHRGGKVQLADVIKFRTGWKVAIGSAPKNGHLELCRFTETGLSTSKSKCDRQFTSTPSEPSRPARATEAFLWPRPN